MKYCNEFIGGFSSSGVVWVIHIKEFKNGLHRKRAHDMAQSLAVKLVRCKMNPAASQRKMDHTSTRVQLCI